MVTPGQAVDDEFTGIWYLVSTDWRLLKLSLIDWVLVISYWYLFASFSVRAELALSINEVILVETSDVLEIDALAWMWYISTVGS